MSWTCFSCLNCGTADTPTPGLCPGCGHPVDEWEGNCSDCPNRGVCSEPRTVM
ncbi:MAG: hypothetical protein ACYC0Q_12930 [Eubacteriales bacterium]